MFGTIHCTGTKQLSLFLLALFYIFLLWKSGIAAQSEAMQPARHHLPQPERLEQRAAVSGQAGAAAVSEQLVVGGLQQRRRDPGRDNSQAAVVIDDEGGGAELALSSPS